VYIAVIPRALPLRRHALRFARRLGVEPQLRLAQDAVSPWYVRRARRDDAHLRAIMAAVLRPDANCIDVGANVGDMLETMTRLAPEGRHIAYEPLPDLAAGLARRFPDVDVRQAALSDAAGEATFYRRTDAVARSGLEPTGESEPITVRLEALDETLPDGYVPHFVKIDVEGAELAVLRGAIETLRRHRPVVALEHGNTALRYGTTHAMVHDLLAGEAGLRIFDLDGEGPLDRATFDRVADPPGRRWNFLARP
jgi:FkbM family methyltransferase